jgi:PhnB protein
MKTLTANPYLSFNGNCREVMNFYKDCIGGELTIMEVKDTPVAAEMPPEMATGIMHCSLTKGTLEIMASDMVGQEGLTVGNNFSICVQCTSEDEVKEYYGKLSEGAKINCPLDVQFWGDTFGHLTDKYGINWALLHSQCEGGNKA